jgi:hypothetical protein
VQSLGYRLDDWDSIPGEGNDGIFFSSPPRLYRFWDPPNLLSNGYQGLITRGFELIQVTLGRKKKCMQAESWNTCWKSATWKAKEMEG